MSQEIAIDLNSEERQLLMVGLAEWSGPTKPTDAIAQAMGFTSEDALADEAGQILDRLRACTPLTAADWARALLATEIAFASDYYGTGYEWHTTTGLDDATTIRVLRDVQHKLVGIARL